MSEMTFQPASMDRVVAFEQMLGRRLPEDYREFLVFGLDRPIPDGEVDLLLIRSDGCPGGGTFAQFRSLAPDNPAPLRCWEPQIIPPESIEIASDCEGKPIALSLADADYGHIYWCDHELAWYVNEDWSYFDGKEEQRLASSFTGLVNLLHDTVDNHDPSRETYTSAWEKWKAKP